MIIVMSKKRILCLSATYIALLLWMLFIFMMSAQNGQVSGNTSGSLIESICSFVIPDFKEFSEMEKADIISKFSLPVRKIAHFTEYFILAFLANLAIMQ